MTKQQDPNDDTELTEAIQGLFQSKALSKRIGDLVEKAIAILENDLQSDDPERQHKAAVLVLRQLARKM